MSWLNNPEVNKFTKQRFDYHTIDSCRAYLKSLEGSHDKMWAIVLREGDRHIGTISAEVDHNNNTADLSLVLGEPDLWGRGYGYEAWSVLMEHLILHGIRKITAETLLCNYAMISIMRKSGMTHEGRLFKQCAVGDRFVDLEFYCKFSPL